MSYVALEDAEIDLGRTYAHERFNWDVTRRNLSLIGGHFLMVRYLEHLKFGEALRSTMDHFGLEGERRERYKAILGKMLGSRRKLTAQKQEPAPFLLDTDGKQYRFNL